MVPHCRSGLPEAIIEIVQCLTPIRGTWSPPGDDDYYWVYEGDQLSTIDWDSSVPVKDPHGEVTLVCGKCDQRWQTKIIGGSLDAERTVQ